MDGFCGSTRSGGAQPAGSRKQGCVLFIASVASMIDQFNMPNIRLLQEMGYRVHVACNFKKGNTCDGERVRSLRRTLQSMRVCMHQWDCPRGIRPVSACISAYLQLCGLLRSQPFTWIHCHSPVGGALARLAAHRFGIPVLYTAHGFHFYKGAPFKNWLLFYPAEKLLSCWTDVLVTVNREDYRFAMRHLKAGKIFGIPGVGVDTGKFAAAGSCGGKQFRKEMGIPEHAWVLLSVGELNEGKNHRAVVSALAALKRRDVYYLVCGQGRLADSLRRYAKSLGVGDFLKLAGYQENMPLIYQSADIFVFPSVREGMPVALMEAMAAGLPCVVSNIRGSRELACGRNPDAPCGICFDLGHPNQIQRAVRRLLEDGRMREIYGRRAQEKVRMYDTAIVQRRMREIYGVMRQACRKPGSAGQDAGKGKACSKTWSAPQYGKTVPGDGKTGTDAQNGTAAQACRNRKVLHVLRTDRYAGAENIALTLCKGLRERGPDAFETAYASPDGTIGARVWEDGTRFYPMRACNAKELRRVLREFQPDIVHAHDYTASVLCALLKKNFCLVSHLHNNPPWIRRWGAKSWAYFLAEKKMDRILAVSGQVQEEAVFLRRVRTRVLPVPNPVDAAALASKAEAFTVQKTDLVFVGRFTKQKNPRRFIRTAARLERQAEGLSAVMVGDGEEKDACRRMVKRLGLERQIRLTGFVENPYPYIRQAKLLLVTSDWEGYGLAAAEAAVLHTPVLAMARGGLCSIFKDFPQALCTTEEELYRKAAALLLDGACYRRFKNEMRCAVRPVDVGTYVEKMADIYGELLR